MAKRRRARMRKLLYTAPRLMYQSRLGSVLGKRFIAIEHEGRNTGTTYLTPVEVIYHDKESNEYYVVSARGDRADWYRNISKYPATAVYFGSRKRRVDQRMVPVDEAVAAMKIYEQDHPRAAVALLELAGITDDSSTMAWRSAVEKLPMVAFRPR